MKTTLLASVAALLLALSTPCQDGGDLAQVRKTSQTDAFVLEAGNIDVAKLIDRVATYLDYNILFSEQEMATLGQIRLTRRTETDRAGCWELFGSLLYYKGLAVIVLDKDKGFFEVIAMNGQRGREVANSAVFVPIEQIETYANEKATPILTTVPLQNINATIATNGLRPFFASSGSAMGGSLMIGNAGNSSDMLLQGFGPQVAAACRLLKLIDVGDDGGRPCVQVVRLEHAAAADLVAPIDEVFNGSARQARLHEAGMPMNTLQTVAHPTLNALILSGSSTQVRDAMELIANLDVASVASGTPSDALSRRVRQLEDRVEKLEQALRARSVQAGSGQQPRAVR